MPRYRNALPQLSGDLFLTDGGLETTLIFKQGIEIPHFAAITLLKSEGGRAALREYFQDFAAIAKARDAGFIFDSVTWRAGPDWAEPLGYTVEGLEQAIRDAIAFQVELRDELEGDGTRVVINALIGPRGDGYDPDRAMTADEAEAYHARQLAVLAETEADLACALTMNNAVEAIGIAKAAGAVGLPIVISFTVETDGKLPTGQTLKDAIQAVDDTTNEGPVYYMINCAHPDHFDHVLTGEPWTERIRGIRANASRKSHAELDESEELDEGNPRELGAQYLALRERLPKLSILGGCCGTDHGHVEQIAKVWV